MLTPSPPQSTGSGPFGVPGGTDRSYQVDIIVCAVITAFIGTLFVTLRFYTRTVIIAVLCWADWLILVAQVSGQLPCSSSVPRNSVVWKSTSSSNSCADLLHRDERNFCPRYAL